jgi:hypothetical protein
MIQKGKTDSGKPLHLYFFQAKENNDFDEYFTKNKAM